MSAFADVSINLIPCSLAIWKGVMARLVYTFGRAAKFESFDYLTASPLSVLTTRFSSMSLLFPSIIFSTSSFACWNNDTSKVMYNHWAFLSLSGKEIRVYTYFVDVSQPFNNILECFLVGNVVNEHDTHSAPVVRRSDGMESLLSSCIPVNT